MQFSRWFEEYTCYCYNQWYIFTQRESSHPFSHTTASGNNSADDCIPFWIASSVNTCTKDQWLPLTLSITLLKISLIDLGKSFTIKERKHVYDIFWNVYYAHEKIKYKIYYVFTFIVSQCSIFSLQKIIAKTKLLFSFIIKSYQKNYKKIHSF